MATPKTPFPQPDPNDLPLSPDEQMTLYVEEQIADGELDIISHDGGHHLRQCGASVEKWVEMEGPCAKADRSGSAPSLGASSGLPRGGEPALSWRCDKCGNFALFGDEEVISWADFFTIHCHACGSFSVENIDPAQGALLDKAGYLAKKKDVGVNALLAGNATHCQECGVVTFVPWVEG